MDCHVALSWATSCHGLSSLSRTMAVQGRPNDGVPETCARVPNGRACRCLRQQAHDMSRAHLAATIASQIGMPACFHALQAHSERRRAKSGHSSDARVATTWLSSASSAPAATLAFVARRPSNGARRWSKPLPVRPPRSMCDAYARRCTGTVRGASGSSGSHPAAAARSRTKAGPTSQPGVGGPEPFCRTRWGESHCSPQGRLRQASHSFSRSARRRPLIYSARYLSPIRQ